MKLYSCYKCGEKKLKCFFSKDSSRTTGIGSRCKKCQIDLNKLVGYSRSPAGKIKAKLRSNLRRRLRDFVKGKRNIASEVGLTSVELKSYIESTWTNGMSWDNYGHGTGKWNIDHIRPIKDFMDKGEDVKKSNHYTNLRALWHEDNMLKGARF